MSELKTLIQEHREAVKDLRDKCRHPAKMISFRLDHSAVGRGSSVPPIHLTCTNCGMVKVIFEVPKNEYRKVRKTMGKQGFKDERTDLYFQYDWELELVDTRRK